MCANLRAAFDGGRVDDHLVHGDGHGGVVAQHHHAQRIADENQIDAGFVDGQRAGIIIGGDHRDGFAALFLGVQGGDGDFLAIHVDSPSTDVDSRSCCIVIARPGWAEAIPYRHQQIASSACGPPRNDRL